LLLNFIIARKPRNCCIWEIRLNLMWEYFKNFVVGNKCTVIINLMFPFNKYRHRTGVFLIGDQHQISGCWSVNILCRCCCFQNALRVKSYVLCQLCYMYMYMWIVGAEGGLRGRRGGKKVASALVLASEGIRYTTRVIDCMKVGLSYTSWHMSVLTFVRYTESSSVRPSVRPSVNSETVIGCS